MGSRAICMPNMDEIVILFCAHGAILRYAHIWCMAIVWFGVVLIVLIFIKISDRFGFGFELVMVSINGYK